MECNQALKFNKTQYDWFPGKSQIQRSLVQNLSKIQQRLKIIGRFLTFWGVKIPPDGHNLGVKITSKMNSQHRGNTQCANFQQNLTTFKKSLLGGGFLTFLGLKMPLSGRTRIFPTYTLSFSQRRPRG